jgi:hypothetical protein
MGTTRDLRKSSHEEAGRRVNAGASVRVAYLSGLIGCGLTAAVRGRVQMLLAERGILCVDPESDYEHHMLAGPPYRAAQKATGLAARCDFIVSVPSFGEPNEVSFEVAAQVRRLGMTTFVWPGYGQEGPPSNPAYRLASEIEAVDAIASWQPERSEQVGISSVTGVPTDYARANQAGAACPQPTCAAASLTPNRVGYGEHRQMRSTDEASPRCDVSNPKVMNGDHVSVG